jgi:hypothetical protein
MNEAHTPGPGAVGEALDKTQTLVGTTHELIEDVLERFGNSADKAVAKALKGVGRALGPIGALAGIGLGYADEGKVGAIGALAGAATGIIIGLGVSAIVTTLIPGLAVSALTAGVLAGAVIVGGGIASWFATEFAEDLVKDYLKDPPAKEPGSNLPDPIKNKPSLDPDSEIRTVMEHRGTTICQALPQITQARRRQAMTERPVREQEGVSAVVTEQTTLGTAQTPIH